MDFDVVYREHLEYVKRLAIYLVRNETDGADIAQDTFVLFLKRPHYDGTARQMRNLLGKLCRYSALMFLRDCKRHHQASSWDEALEAEPEHGKPLWQVAESPEGYALAKELLDLLTSLDIPEHERATAIRMALGYDCGECAERLGVSKTSASQYGFNGRKKMREAYAAA